MPNYPAQIAGYRCGRGERLLVIAGPCVIESLDLCLHLGRETAPAEALREFLDHVASRSGKFL